MDCNPVAIRTSQPLQRFLKVTSTFVPSTLYLILLVLFQYLVFKGLRRSASRGKARTEIYYVVIRGFMAPSIYNNPAEALKEPCSFRWAYIEQYPTWNTAAFAWRSVLFGHIVSPIGIPDYLLALLLIFAEGAESSDEQDSPWWHHATHASW